MNHCTGEVLHLYEYVATEHNDCLRAIPLRLTCSCDMSKRKATAYVFLAMADGADQTRMNAHGATVLLDSRNHKCLTTHVLAAWAYRDNGKNMETTIVYWDYVRIMEKKMETAIVYWGYTVKLFEKGLSQKVTNSDSPDPNDQ